MIDTTDEQLLAAYRTGEREAFAVLVARHEGLVRAACLRQAPSADCEDCIQAVFLVLARRPAAAAQAPVPVTLRSDNATQVEILRVGPVGTFERHSLSLIPGRYTAVGRRTGYRDVRVQFEVAPTEQLLEVVVQCIERIR